jgi:hypothetical protein
VIIAIDPQLALGVHAALLATGIVTGYAVDALGVSPRLPAIAPTLGPTPPAAPTAGGRSRARLERGLSRTPVSPGAVAAVAVAPLGALPRAFWALWLAGTVVAAPVAFQVTDGPALSRWFAGVDPYLLLGVLGSACAVALHLARGGSLRDDTVETVEQQQSSIAGMLRHAAHETSFVTTWVALAYLLTTWVIELGGVDLSAVVSTAGLAGVALGALIGLVPGCAPQVLLTGLYATGAVPLPTLLANAVSQDGDALFPLLFMDRRASALAAVITTIPALVVGTVWWLLA